jgi:hypothetical protein
MSDASTPPPSTAIVPREDAAPSAAKVPARLGVVPGTVEEAWRLATMMAKSELVPKAFRDRPADVVVAVQLGAEIGLAPMQSLQSIAVINGRPGVWGDGMLAIVMASPLYQDHEEYFEVDGHRRDGLTLDDLKRDATAAVCTFIRRGKPAPVTRRFSVGQARKAQLLGKEGPWQAYPDRMLAMRARSFAARDTFPDLLRGLHTAEELRDMPADPPSPLRRVLRASELTPAETVDVPTPPTRYETVTGTIAALEGDRLVILTTGEQLAIDAADLATSRPALAQLVGRPVTFSVYPDDGELVIETFATQ